MDDFDWSMMGDFGSDAGFDWSSLVDLDLPELPAWLNNTPDLVELGVDGEDVLPSFPAETGLEVPVDYESMIPYPTQPGGFTSGWQTVGDARVFVRDDGTANVLNPNTGAYSYWDADQVAQMIKNGSLNSASSGYNAATGGTNSAPGGSAPPKSVADRLKDLLKGNGGLNKLAIGALGAYLANKADGDKKGGGWTPPAANLTYNRGTLAQDPGRRPGAANPGGYFTPVTYAAQGGLMRPAHKMKAGGGIEGLLKGQGDGLSDSIPATIDGQKPAQLATDEYVVSADVVAALGGGSADAGARRLDEMMSRVRTQAHGHDRQTRPVSDKALPA